MLSLDRWGTTRARLKEILEAQADNTTENKGKVEPEKSDQDKQGKIPLRQVFRKNIIKGKIEPELRVLESQRAGTGF